MLTHVNFPTFAMSDLRYGGLIRCSTRLHGCISAEVCPAYAATSLVRCTNRPFGHQRGIYETSHNLSLTHARRHIWRWRRTQLRPLSAGDRTSRMRLLTLILRLPCVSTTSASSSVRRRRRRCAGETRSNLRYITSVYRLMNERNIQSISKGLIRV